MYDVTNLTVPDMTRCGAVLRTLDAGVDCMVGAAQSIVQHLEEHLVDGATGEPAMVLTRFFKTHPYGDLDEQLQRFASSVAGDTALDSDTNCLTLLASAGREPQWNTRSGSEGHQAIPLASEEIVQQAPMISSLVSQLGLEISAVLSPDAGCIQDLEQRTYNVFHVAEAQGSPHIPAQEEFIVPYGIKSVLGFGGMLPSGHLFVVIMFSAVPIPDQTAGLFKPLALAAKLSVLPFERAVFAQCS